jgi:hypothetical protein
MSKEKSKMPIESSQKEGQDAITIQKTMVSNYGVNL